ncbi:uncharacterized protein LOC111607158 [Xiphophorus maculatus]|uniref:uncharacterized protein LOC111607158 n=1 Tax=Xiphophorus maculatus TaxID=8083 RepID=UPI000C6E2B16|nr:uncharacterized protein LOC111607158 [Xiphophorus maculatus]
MEICHPADRHMPTDSCLQPKSQDNRHIWEKNSLQLWLSYEQCCEHCGKKVMGAVGLLHHIEEGHEPPGKTSPSMPDQHQAFKLHGIPATSPHKPAASPQKPAASSQKPAILPQKPAASPQKPALQPQQCLATVQHPQPTPSVASSIPHLRPPEVNWVSFLPKQFLRVIKPADQQWIAQCLYNSTGQFKQHFSQNWFHPPSLPKIMNAPPDPLVYFRQRMFLWAPMRMWGISLKCHQCNTKMHHSGIYTKVREVIDLDSRYYLIGGDYPRCSKCMIPVCPWSTEVLNQLDPAHRNRFPAILTTQLALDKRCVTLLKPRTVGNSSSYVQQALEELHSEEWAKRTIDYLTDCELHKKKTALSRIHEVVYQNPPEFSPLPLAQWFETVHANEILCHLSEMKGVITSTYGRILKLDSTKKITKKLAGGISETATWMTNITNEYGQVLNCVLTTGEGAGLEELCQGIVMRFRNAGEPEPQILYVDRDCCSESGVPPVLEWFRPWKTKVRLDIFHYMRRFTTGLTTEHHPLYGTFCSKLSCCIFEWDQDDVSCLKEAKRSELKKKYTGHPPTDAQVLANINSSELAKHCRRRTRGVEETRNLIQELLNSMWELTDTSGLRLINPESMTHVWQVQQKHLPCIQDPPGVELYTKLRSTQKGDKEVQTFRCSRGSSSVESFHRHQCSFIPGWRSNAMHTQMYMLEGGSRWNMKRTQEALDMSRRSHSKLYDVRLMSNLNTLSNKVLGHALLPEFVPPGCPTGERIAVEYLLAQSDRGDLLGPQQDSELGVILPEMPANAQEDSPDVTISDVTDILSESPHDMLQCESQLEMPSPNILFLQEESSPMSSQETSIDSTPASPTHAAASVGGQLTDDHSFSGPSSCSQVDQVSQETRCDYRGFPGWEAVDSLAEYLLSLNRTITALSTTEVENVLQLYSNLHAMDKQPAKYTLKTKKSTLPGPWRASRKRSGSAPGQQAAERLFMTHGQAAQRPDANRVSECVCLKLLKEYQQARNRPKDSKGKVLPIPQSIVQTYCHFKQLLEDSRPIQDQTNLLLVTINNTTVCAWLHERQKRTDRDTLLQGVNLPPKVSVADASFPQARQLPSLPVEHGHKSMEFKEPENREGEALIRQRVGGKAGSAQQCPPSYQPGLFSQAPVPASFLCPQTNQPPSSAWSYCEQNQMPQAPSTSLGFCYGPPAPVLTSFGQGQFPPLPSPLGPLYQYYRPPLHSSIPAAAAGSASSSPSDQAPANMNRYRKWRQNRAELEDQERLARGEPPKKRQWKQDYHYQCSVCGQAKNKSTGHTQIKGKWYCPASGQTILEWKESLGKQ